MRVFSDGENLEWLAAYFVPFDLAVICPQRLAELKREGDLMAGPLVFDPRAAHTDTSGLSLFGRPIIQDASCPGLAYLDGAEAARFNKLREQVATTLPSGARVMHPVGRQFFT